MADERRNDIVIRGRSIREDGTGKLLLDDIWELAKGKPSQVPRFWRFQQGAKALINALKFKVRNSNIKSAADSGEPIYAKRGQGQKGTYAHPIIAAAYAGYLDPDLEIEVREIWLRYRAGDATLADEILQRATAEENLWAGTRALGRAQRNGFTDVLKAHGVHDHGYRACTEAVYVQLLGGESWQVRNAMGLPRGTNLRDVVDIGSLSLIAAAEALAAERIEEEGCTGNFQCEQASSTAAKAIRRAVDEDRRSRKKRAA